MKSKFNRKSIVLALILLFNVGLKLEFSGSDDAPKISLGQFMGNSAYAEEMPPSCPVPELSYSLYSSTEKYCPNENVWLSYEECDYDAIQCCPGLDLEPEPQCFELD